MTPIQASPVDRLALQCHDLRGIAPSSGPALCGYCYCSCDDEVSASSRLCSVGYCVCDEEG